MKRKYIKREYGRNRYQNMPEENKERQEKYQKRYRDVLHCMKMEKKAGILVKNVLTRINFKYIKKQLVWWYRYKKNSVI